ncbi:conserved protein of unknown function (plasmid) [Cupriavidus taiwanensis]|uniref:Transposase TnpC homeodomain domain-containing protein n=1 Tax=Cupriavidus taiwanensis TaxID=164546 RepID=A0A375IU99_9BURK|nr:conserved protein of unknown function [Cupriavidus taiwanensis]
MLIAKLRRMKFGCRSEKLDRQIEQLELRLEELEATKVPHPSRSPGRRVRHRNRYNVSRCQNTCRARP